MQIFGLYFDVCNYGTRIFTQQQLCNYKNAFVPKGYISGCYTRREDRKWYAQILTSGTMKSQHAFSVYIIAQEV